MSNLPDPTADLDWLGYGGAIQDAFDANAAKHPDAVCVIETESSTTPRRTFTYRSINEASNVLAHYLIVKGVELGDVVMVYAYRGVDLVVAVMGVLKAGGTFSVIDPLYPLERQKVYLEVAQPRALVNIQKATEDAGPLPSLVRRYIDKSLELKAEVPALRLHDNGKVSGGSISEQDVFADVQYKAGQHPGVIVGPDSNPTLSFTSGSEGRPKGVLGRHFSLTYYFPWMKERFELSEHDKFTMLSGIAHDPIQRDIFTPLFLGAQLLVPAKEDIQHEKLAEWMKRFEATVTHLTPAMGQIMVGGASAEFPSLKRAFFVGDVLTKRDCSLLRALAMNVNIVNMYGTTETQRAVSYFEIPSRARDPAFLDCMKEVIPAGRGMHNVQLLVVDRTDRMKTCPVGEIGEIFVRAAGLSEGYLGDPALNEKKFLPNWFVQPRSREHLPVPQLFKGLRDRLYRTGDLGRYLPSGDVECCGRADDQVKIRGFRIELGDINSQLSQHPLVRDNVTLLRRDKVEEPTLVSYVVPEFTRWASWLAENGFKDPSTDESMAGLLQRFRPLQNELRRHLKGKLPSYAVPTFFIPLLKLPLNPNGKVDKPALPFPDIVDITAVTSEESEERWKSLSSMEKMVATIWGELIHGCNAKAIQSGDSFFDLGGHSILAQQMLLMVRRELKVASIPIAYLFHDPSLKGFSASLDRMSQSELNGAKNADHRMVNGSDEAAEYSADARRLVDSLPSKFPSAESLSPSRPLTVFLTGASGFLGAFLLRDLLSRQNPPITVIAHVRAKSQEAATQRLVNSCTAYGIWRPPWQDRLRCITGNLGEPKLGIADDRYQSLVDEVDVVIHNGAQVHWVYPYAKLRPTNVQGTIEALQMCASGRPKQFAFVSSTSVLDNDHYVQLSEKAIQAGGAGILESDDLQGSSTGLSTGYGQSKWASELLVRESGHRGLMGVIVRPGYILGDSKSGGESRDPELAKPTDMFAVTNSDDFLIRALKGCVQLSSRPHITNTVNMVPADHVARVVVACALHPPVAPLGVAHVTSHPRLRFDEFLSTLGSYGYDTKEVDYATWRDQLEKYVSEGPIEKDYEQHALMPLYHFVTNDLPANTKASELDDRNAVAALQADARWTGEDLSAGSAVTRETVGKYLRFLTLTGFLEQPTGKGEPFPEIDLAEGQDVAYSLVGGRGGGIV